MRCPYCKQENFVPENVVRNIEKNGPCVCKFECIYCGGLVKADLGVKMVVNICKRDDGDKELEG